jgi:ribosome maturation factor RimP
MENPVWGFLLAEIFMRDVTMNELEAILTPSLAAIGIDWWGGVLQRRSRSALLRIYIDKPSGITVDDCARASHHIKDVLAVNDPVQGDYTLEVSSPGMDRPLFKPAQYAQFIGEKIKLKCRLPLEGQRQFQGLLRAADTNEVTLQCDQGSVTVLFENIERANVVPDFLRSD